VDHIYELPSTQLSVIHKHKHVTDNTFSRSVSFTLNEVLINVGPTCPVHVYSAWS